MGPKSEELVSTLDELISILDGDGQTHWSKWMKQARSRIVSSDFSGVEKVLLAYGGMGSFNDVCLRQITMGNENFSNLQTRAYELAAEIKYELESNA